MNVEVEMIALETDFVLRRIEVKHKRDSRFMRILAKGLSWITLGKAGGDQFMNGYVTTIGRTIYVPDGWEQQSTLQRLSVLTHESHHVKQLEQWSVLMSLWYFMPLPMFLAYGRYCIERSAYVEGWKVYLAVNPEWRSGLIDDGVLQMTGPAYGWAWPFPKSVRAWFEAHVPKA